MYPDELGGLRSPSVAEMDLIRRLLSVDFQGAETLRDQLVSALVEPIDGDGSLRIRPAAQTRAAVSRRTPVEATYADPDGVLVHVLVHVVGGVLDELEVFREDSGAVMVAPTDTPALEIEAW